MFNLHCKQDIRQVQNSEVNLVSLSLIILFGIPNLQTHYSKNNLAHVAASMSDVVGISNVNLLNLSTIVNTASCPRSVRGSCTTKSIDTTSKGLEGTLCGTS